MLWQLLFRLFFPGYYSSLRDHQVRLELWKSPRPLGADVPDDFPDDWELVADGGQNEGDRVRSATPTKCPCGTDWRCNNASKHFNARPAAADITALYNTIQAPAVGECDGDCIARETFRGECFTIWRHKVARTFWLYCSKRVQWHCEIEG